MMRLKLFTRFCFNLKKASILVLSGLLCTSVLLSAQVPSPSGVATPVTYEPLPTLDANAILQPQYLIGPNFTVRNSVPTSSGSNRYTIDSDFGPFEADGNEML